MVYSKSAALPFVMTTALLVGGCQSVADDLRETISSIPETFRDDLPNREEIEGLRAKVAADLSGAANLFRQYDTQTQTTYQTQASSTRASSETPDQRTLNKYSRSGSYAAQGAVVGAVAGAMGGCVLADSCRDGAIAGALIGAAAGAGGGYIVGKRADANASREQQLEVTLEAAEREAAEARQARIASEKIVANHKRTLNELEAQASKSEQDRLKYVAALAEAEKDVASMANARGRLEKELASLDKEIETRASQPGGVSPQLVAARDQLRAERDQIDRELNAMASDLEERNVPIV